MDPRPFLTVAAQQARLRAEHSLCAWPAEARLAGARERLQAAGAAGEPPARAAAEAYDRVCAARAGCSPEDHACASAIKAAAIPVRDAVVLEVLSHVGHASREAFFEALEDAFGRRLDDKLQSQMHHAYGHLMAGVPGKFDSQTKALRRKRPRRAREAEGDGSSSSDQLAPRGAGPGQPLPRGLLAGTRVPASLDCSPGHRVQMDGLLSKISESTLTHEVCSDCVKSLDERLRELPWSALASTAGQQFTSSIAKLLSAAMMRFPTNFDVREWCVASLVNLCRKRGDMLGLQVPDTAEHEGDETEFASQPSILMYEEGVRQDVQDALATALADENYQESPYLWWSDAHALLARTQTLPQLLNKVSTNSSALDEVLTEACHGLFWCLKKWATPSDPFSKWEVECARSFLLEVQKQRIVLGSCTQTWVQKEYESKYMRQVRFMLVGLLFGVEQHILVPLRNTRDEVEMSAALIAIQDLNAISKFDFDTASAVVTCILSMVEQGEVCCNRMERGLECRAAYISTLGAMMQGAAKGGGWPQDLTDKAIGEALDVVTAAQNYAMMQWDWQTMTNWDWQKILEEWVAPVLHVVLWALGEIFEGASSLGEWEKDISDVARYVLKDFSQLDRRNKSVSGSVQEAGRLFGMNA